MMTYADGTPVTPIICEQCGVDMRSADAVPSCTPKNVRGLAGLPYEWPPDMPPGMEQPPPDQTCHDCWVPLGAWHHWECCVELCPWCGDQLLFCGHF